MISIKVAHQIAKFQKISVLTARVKFHQICTLIGYFCWKYIKSQLKKVWKEYVFQSNKFFKVCTTLWYLMIPRSGEKFEKKTYFLFQIDKNLVNFDPSTKRSKKFALWLVSFVQSIQPLTWKRMEEIYFMTPKSHAKFEKKLTCGLENDRRNLVNFHQSTHQFSPEHTF